MKTKISQELQKHLSTAATELNFYGKRLRAAKLAVAEAVQAEFPALKDFEAGTLVDWLNDNKPEKPKAKKAANKPAANTMTGNETRQRDNIEVLEGSKFIVTAAQNNTIPSSVFAQLEHAADKTGAQLIVVPVYYNKNAFSATVESETEYFNPALTKYLQTEDCWLGGVNCVKVAAQAAIPLTAKQPINAASTINTGELATIVPHMKQQQKTLLRMAGEEIKTAWTTGGCTVYNYLRGRAGTEAEHFHCFGAVLVEIDKNGKPFCTNLAQSIDGSLIFVDYDLVTHEIGVNEFELDDIEPIITVGDSHFEQFDSACYDSVKDLLLATGCRKAMLHDIAHSESRNHHNVNRSSHWYKQKQSSIFEELKFIIEKVNGYAEICDIYLVESNHNSVIDGWLDSQATANNITFDTVNTKLYHLLKFLMCEAIDNGEDYRALALAFSNSDLSGLPELSDNVEWGSCHVPETHYGTEFNTHGHKGANGAAKGLTTGRISQSMVLGHTHSPEICYMTPRGGIVTVGTTASLDQGYNRGGGSSWGQSSAITHPNGITQQFFHFLD